MKKLLMALALLPLMAAAETWYDPSTRSTWLYSEKPGDTSGRWGGVVCELDNGEIEIGPGERHQDKFAVSPAPTGAVVIPATINGFSVVSVGCAAFEDSALTSITFPPTVRYIGGWAISGCKKLKFVVIPGSVVWIGEKAFDGCTALEKVSLSEGLKYIDENAFDGCVKLAAITFPDSLQVIEENAFIDCRALKSIKVSRAHADRLLGLLAKSGFDVSGVSVRYADEDAPGALVYQTEPNYRDGGITLTGIASGTPSGTLYIPSTYKGQTVTAIGADFLRKNESVTSVTLERGILSIGEKAFSGCKKLTAVSLPEGLESIGRGAFSGFNPIGKLKSLAIPSTVRSIGLGAFACNSLESISISGGDNDYFSAANGILYDKVGKRVICSCINLSKAVLPDDCEIIGQDAFSAGWSMSSRLAEVVWPPRLKTIEQGAFHMCTKLKTGDFSSTVLETIDEDVFVMCTSLVTVRFPSSLRALTGHDFSCCSSLKQVYFAGRPPEILMKSSSNKDMLDCIYVTTPNLAVGYSDSKQYKYTYLPFVTTYVTPGLGWDDVVRQGTWQGVPVRFVGESPLDEEYCFIPGEAVSFDTGLIGYTAKGLPNGLKYNKKTGKITGAAKKPTAEGGVTVKFTKKGETDVTMTIVVGPIPTISVTLEGDIEKCKVTGANKAYLVGKKVTLQAKGPKGTAFVGWFKDGEPWPNEEESKNAKLSYVMTKDSISLVAKFEKEKMRVACPALAAASFTVGVAGTAAGIPIEIETQSGVKSVAVSKLPAGMKYDKKTGLIVGAPTKAGTFDVTIKVTAKSGAVETLVVPVTVAALPDWAVGTFVGLVRQVDYDAQGNVVVDGDGRHDWYDGEVAVTVSAKGKISGELKLPDDGGTGSFAFSAFASCDEGGCSASGSMKLGKSLKMDVELQIRERTLTEGASNLAGDLEIRMRGTEDSMTIVFSTDESRPLRQQIWKSKTLPLPPSIDKKSVAIERDGHLYTLSFGKSGAVDDTLASADNPKKVVKKGKPVFSVVGYWDAAWHCELFGTPIIDTTEGGGERIRFDVCIADSGLLICTPAE